LVGCRQVITGNAGPGGLAGIRAHEGSVAMQLPRLRDGSPKPPGALARSRVGSPTTVMIARS
jgi:hypothetical protein